MRSSAPGEVGVLREAPPPSYPHIEAWRCIGFVKVLITHHHTPPRLSLQATEFSRTARLCVRVCVLVCGGQQCVSELQQHLKSDTHTPNHWRPAVVKVFICPRSVRWSRLCHSPAVHSVGHSFASGEYPVGRCSAVADLGQFFECFTFGHDW